MSHPQHPLRSDALRSHLRPMLSVALAALLAAPFAAADAPAPAPAPAAPAKAAPAGVFIAVRNLAGESLKDREQSFEDLVASRVAASDGIAILSRNEAVKRLAAAGTPVAALEGAKVDAAFDDRTSALRLAQTLDASGILSVSLVSLGKETVAFKGSGIETINDQYTLRGSWKLLEAGAASGIVGDVVTAKRTVRQTAGVVEIPGDLLNGLLDDAADKVAEAVRTRLSSDKNVAAALKDSAAKRVKFTVNVSAQNIFFPELAADKDGVLRISQEKSPVRLEGVTVELDGAAIGTAPFAAGLVARPGLHRMRLSREGFKPWEGVVNLYEGFAFNAQLELDEAGLKRWREQSAFIQQLKAGEKLNDARVAYIRAAADNLKNYGYKIDFKVDAKEFPENNGTNVNVIPGSVVR